MAGPLEAGCRFTFAAVRFAEGTCQKGVFGTVDNGAEGHHSAKMELGEVFCLLGGCFATQPRRKFLGRYLLMDQSTESALE